MTVSELIKVLEGYPGEAKVTEGINGNDLTEIWCAEQEVHYIDSTTLKATRPSETRPFVMMLFEE